jgi:hypothetical protein
MSQVKIVLGLAVFCLLSRPAFVEAQELGTAEEARAMLDRAIAALRSNEVTALTEFNDLNNKQFHHQDLFMVCYNVSDGKITAYSSPGLLGVDIRTLSLKDDPIGQRVYDALQNSAQGSIATTDYNFPKPGTTESVSKQFIEARVGSQGCGVAYFK